MQALEFSIKRTHHLLLRQASAGYRSSSFFDKGFPSPKTEWNSASFFREPALPGRVLIYGESSPGRGFILADSPLPQPEDAALVRQARSGDRRAFETLFNRYQGRIYNIVFQAVRNRADADDVTQEVFIQAFRMLPSLRAEGAFASWLYRIALNRARNWRRDHPQGRTVSLSDYTTGEEDIPERDLPDESPGPEDLFERKSARHSVQQAIATLSDDHREVIVLHHLEGLPVEEIASALGVAQGTVKSRLARARNELKRKLKPFVEEM